MAQVKGCRATLSASSPLQRPPNDALVSSPSPDGTPSTATADRRLPWIVAAAVVLPFLGWWTTGLFDLDEGIYAAIVGEMLRRHEWVTPFYNGAPWYEKPILVYWASMPLVAVFGKSVGPRIASVLATWATIGLVAWFARRRLAPGTRYVAPLVLASSLLVVVLGRMMLTDPLLVLFLSATLLWFWESLVGDPRWRIASGAALGFAVLAKGPVSIVFFVIIAAYTFWREKALRPRFRGWWFSGAALCAGVMALWYVPIYLDYKDNFVQGFIVEQNINRFLGGDTAHTVPGLANLVFYLPVILVGMIPWSFYLWRAWPRRREGVDEGMALRRYLATWGVTVVLFFTLAGSKLPHYMLPALIPFGLLVADDCARRWGALSLRRLARPLAWTVAIAIVAQTVFTVYYYGLTVGGRVMVPGFHAELHRIAAHVGGNLQPGDVIVEYQTGRQKEHRQHPLISETSHPSLRFYLDRTIPLTDDFARVIQDPHATWLITRWNRVDAHEVTLARQAGRALERVATPFPQEYYALYRLTPKGAP